MNVVGWAGMLTRHRCDELECPAVPGAFGSIRKISVVMVEWEAKSACFLPPQGEMVAVEEDMGVLFLEAVVALIAGEWLVEAGGHWSHLIIFFPAGVWKSKTASG